MKLIDLGNSSESSFGTPMEAMVRRVNEFETGIYELASYVSRNGGFEPLDATVNEQSTATETTTSTPERMEMAPSMAVNTTAAPEVTVHTEQKMTPEMPVAAEARAQKPKAPIVRSQEEIDQLNKLKDDSYRLLAEALGDVKLDEIEQLAANDPDNSKRELESV